MDNFLDVFMWNVEIFRHFEATSFVSPDEISVSQIVIGSFVKADFKRGVKETVDSTVMVVIFRLVRGGGSSWFPEMRGLTSLGLLTSWLF